MKSYTPAGRMHKMTAHLLKARLDAQALVLQTQETNHLTLQREAAWFVHQLNEIITHSQELIPNYGPLKKGRTRG